MTTRWLFGHDVRFSLGLLLRLHDRKRITEFLVLDASGVGHTLIVAEDQIGSEAPFQRTSSGSLVKP